MSDSTQPEPLTHLSAGALRLAAALGRPRLIAVACIVVLAASGWIALGLIASGSGWLEALCRTALSNTGTEFALALPMWLAMTLAMMLPTAGPMMLTYAEIADTAARQDQDVVSPLVLAAGYLTVWFGFAIGAALLQVTLSHAHLAAGGKLPEIASGVLFGVAGLYQFSAIKQSCLTQCRRPFPFFFANWTTERTGVFKLGLQQGVYCLGCCWALMALMFATGTMNVVWMAILGLVMTIEKMTASSKFTHLIGVALIAIGATFVLSGIL